MDSPGLSAIYSLYISFIFSHSTLNIITTMSHLWKVNTFHVTRCLCMSFSSSLQGVISTLIKSKRIYFSSQLLHTVKLYHNASCLLIRLSASSSPCCRLKPVHLRMFSSFPADIYHHCQHPCPRSNMAFHMKYSSRCFCC